MCSFLYTRVKSGYFGHQGKFGHIFANSGSPDEMAPYAPSHQDFYCLHSYFNFLFPKLNNESNTVAVQIYLMSEVT